MARKKWTILHSFDLSRRSRETKEQMDFYQAPGKREQEKGRENVTGDTEDFRSSGETS